jgi:hypothetical protein
MGIRLIAGWTIRAAAAVHLPGRPALVGPTERQVNMTHFPSVDLLFTYRDDAPRFCHEISGLAKDEIEVVLESLRRHFDKKAPDAFGFRVRTKSDYTTLELVNRRRDGEWADSGIDGKARQSAAVLVPEAREKLTERSRHWLDVRQAAIAMSAGIRRLRSELNLCEPVKSSVLTRLDRSELLEHLDGVDCSLSRWSAPESSMPAETASESAATVTADDGSNREREWSGPMSRSDMARRITGDPSARPRKVQALLERYGLEHIKGRQYRVRLDQMDASTRRKLEKPPA